MPLPNFDSQIVVGGSFYIVKKLPVDSGNAYYWAELNVALAVEPQNKHRGVGSEDRSRGKDQFITEGKAIGFLTWARNTR
jgi:hypothetical protein